MMSGRNAFDENCEAARRRSRRPPEMEAGLAAVELHDELLLDGQLDVLALGEREHLAGVLLGVELQPVGDAAAAGALDRGADEVVLLAPFLDHDGLALA